MKEEKKMEKREDGHLRGIEEGKKEVGKERFSLGTEGKARNEG